MKNKNTNMLTYSSDIQKNIGKEFYDIFARNPIPEDQILSNIGLFINSATLSRLMFMEHMYRQIIDVQGIVIDFGTRWGQNASVFTSLRGIYEPFNRHRKIVCFDTFDGFPDIHENDGESGMMKQNAYSTTTGYEDYLDEILNIQERDNPQSHIKKYEIVKGNAIVKLEEYLEKNPETIIALAYFDFDLYEPTLKCLEKIKSRLVKGSVLGFDELNDHDCPGETTALMEVFGLNNIRLKRLPYVARTSYFVVE